MAGAAQILGVERAQGFTLTTEGKAFEAWQEGMRQAWGRESVEMGVGGSIPFVAAFAERYPDSGIIESYGDQWPAPCIDYWVYVDVETRLATLSNEGWSVDRQEIALSGDGVEDANRLHEHLARILQRDD